MERYLADGNNAKLGLFIAFTVIFFVVSLDWRHYVRYWFRQPGPASRWIRMLLRGFFIFCFFGQISAVVDEFRQRDLSTGDLLATLVYMLGMLVIFAGQDIFMRWRWGKPKQSDS